MRKNQQAMKMNRSANALAGVTCRDIGFGCVIVLIVLAMIRAGLADELINPHQFACDTENALEKLNESFDLLFKEANTIRTAFSIDEQTERIGIGTTFPNATLHLDSDEGFWISSPTDTPQIRLGSTETARVIRKNDQGDIEFADLSGNTLFMIKENGNMGLGTTDPSERLEVAGGMYLNGGHLQMTHSLPEILLVDDDDNSWFLRLESQDLIFGSEETPFLIMNGEGDLGIGVPSKGATLHVAHAMQPSLQLEELDGLENRKNVKLELHNGILQFYSEKDEGGSALGTLMAIDLGMGNVGIGTSSPYRKLFVNGDAGGLSAWYNASDERLKKNIKTIETPLKKVLALRGVTFEWADPHAFSRKRQMGFIGQEAAEVIPEVVEKKNGRYTMQYAPITALLVEAVKTQHQTIRQQRVKINDQIHRVKALEERVGEHRQTLEAQSRKIEALVKENQTLSQVIQELSERIERIDRKVDRVAFDD